VVGENFTFDFQTAQRILFGTGSVARLGTLALEYGHRAFWITTKRRPFHQIIEESLLSAGIEFQSLEVHGEPKIGQVVELVKQIKDNPWDMIIATGGGSVIDLAKAVAALSVNPGDPLDYLEVVGTNKPLEVTPLPVLAIPTTAGTGSEVTRNAVITLPQHGVKVSLRSPKMLPVLALVDPALTVDLPPEVTASTGMDALTQVIEPYVSNRANVMTDLFCEGGIRRISRSILKAYQAGNDLDARQDMAFGSLMGGLALANAGLGAVHGLAAPIGGMFQAPHGAICARLLPVVCRVNIEVLRRKNPKHPQLKRYQQVAAWLTGEETDDPMRGVQWLENICKVLNIPPLQAYGIQRKDFSVIAEAARRASSMKANPVELEDKDLIKVLEMAY